uniref:Conotoxin Im6.1 n=1 Tax=Conus imperialis TaxID=35631 RepID=M63_CONIM|nr:RecName: Full=Conotoxin Im6.1; AltName: Full=Conotoxin 3; Flags: Precursor [Conus imperialis]ACI96055.1 M superfamily conotoxin 3 precursor [Conus imperialis]
MSKLGVVLFTLLLLVPLVTPERDGGKWTMLAKNKKAMKRNLMDFITRTCDPYYCNDGKVCCPEYPTCGDSTGKLICVRVTD